MEARAGGVLKAQGNTGPQIIDNASPPLRQAWTKMQNTIYVPPGEVWDINLRLYAPNGTVRWDDVKLVAMDSLDTADHSTAIPTATDMGYILSRLVQHVQSVVAGKSPLYIGDNCATVGHKLLKIYQFVDHVQFDQATRELTERDDGPDYYIDITPTTRTYTSFAGKRGVDRHASVTLRYDTANPTTTNCTDYRLTRDGSGCITRQTILGSDNGPAREQGEIADTSHVGGVILQDVRQAPQNSEASSLTPIAQERINRFAAPPENLEMDVEGSAGFIPTLKCGDLVSIVVNDGYTQVSETMRIMQIKLNCVTNIQTVIVARDTL